MTAFERRTARPVAMRIAGVLGDVADVAPVRGEDERRPAGERGQRGDPAGGQEEVGVDDVGIALHRVAQRIDREAALLALAAAAVVDDRGQDLVAHGLQGVGDLRDEDAVVRVVRARPHRGHEEDPHRAYPETTGAGPSARSHAARRSSLPACASTSSTSAPTSDVGGRSMPATPGPDLAAQALALADEHLVHRLAGRTPMTWKSGSAPPPAPRQMRAASSPDGEHRRVRGGRAAPGRAGSTGRRARPRGPS